MMATSWHAAPPAPFDEIAPFYDAVFSRSLIGEAQRKTVWKHIDRMWNPGDHILELNCGTGEDALHLASRGIKVLACDASAAMIEVAERKKSPETAALLEFRVLPNEFIGGLLPSRQFDGVLSNFSGLNCVPDLPAITNQLVGMVRPGGQLALCFSSRYCLWEFLWYLSHREPRKAVRRWSGHVQSSISGRPIDVWYPEVSTIADAFRPWFRLTGISGVGTAIPPSYAEGWVQSHPRFFSTLCGLDRITSSLPIARTMGDHMLLRFRRSS